MCYTFIINNRGKEKMKNSKNNFSLILSMLIFGTIGIFRRYIPWQSGAIACARGIIGFVFLILFVLLTGKKISFGCIKRNLVLLLLSGAFIGFNWILLFEAYNYTTVATATLCYYMQPIFVILVSPLFFKEKLTPKKLLCAAAAFGGMVLISGVGSAEETSENELKGILFGLGAALLYSAVVIMNKKLKNISAYDKTIVQLGTSALVVLPYTLLFENFAVDNVGSFTVVMILIVGILHTGIAYALYFGSMDGLKAQTIAIFSYIDPVVAIILSAVVLKEKITVFDIVGAVLVLGATFISEFDFGSAKKKAEMK